MKPEFPTNDDGKNPDFGDPFKAIQRLLPKVADNILALGQDLAAFLRQARWGGSLDTEYEVREDGEALASFMKAYTSIVADRVSKLGDPRDEGPLRSAFLRSQNALANASQKPMRRIGDNPEEVKLIKADFQYANMYDVYTCYKMPGGRESDLDRLNKILTKKKVSVIKRSELARRLKTDVDQIQGVKPRMRTLFTVWCKFLLWPKAQKRYDIATRRIITNILPLKTDWYIRGGAHQGDYALLYHAVRGELNQAPRSLGKRTKYSDWTLQQAMERLKEWKDWAEDNKALPEIRENWDRSDHAVHRLDPETNE